MLGTGRAATGDMRHFRMPAPRKAVKQSRPSETNVAGAASDFSAKAWIDSFVKGHCDRHIKTGCPEAVV